MICIYFDYPVSSLTKSSNDPRELYLGLLYPTEDYKVYPFSKLENLLACIAGQITEDCE